MTEYLPQYRNPKRVLSTLLKELASKQIEHRRKQIKQVIMEKRHKIKSMYDNSSHQVIQPSLKPTKLSYGSFMPTTPIATEQQFISEKIKANVLTPERFYTHEPNIKSGSFSQPKKWSIPVDQKVVNNQFQEYNRIVDQQTGFVKRAKINQILAAYSTEPMKNKYSRMKKTYFHKFMPDKYNFYTTKTQKTINLDSTSVLKKSRSRVLDTMETNILDAKRESLPVVKRQSKTIIMQEIKSNRSQDRSRQKIKSMSKRERLKTIVYQKNMDSLN